MAVTGFWPIYKNLKVTLDYADNPDKTTAREYLDDDLYAALSYAENDNKTDRKMYTGGINCSKQNAYAEMIAVQQRFGLRGTVVGYHGIKSFREGEVTPEQAQLLRRNPQGCCRRVCSECITGITKKEQVTLLRYIENTEVHK